MPMIGLLTVRLSGSMSQGKLDRFRKKLRLTKRGRLTDEEDAQFGYRYLRDEQDNWVRLSLWRTDDTHWYVDLTYMNEPVPAEVVEKCRADILKAAGQGFTVDHVWQAPAE